MISLQERNALVLQYRRLVCKIARRLYQGTNEVRRIGTLDDVMQIGQLALIRAAEGYDQNHRSGAQFITYASSSIWNSIVNQARESSLIRVPCATYKAAKATRTGTKAWHKLRPETIEQAVRVRQFERLPKVQELCAIEDKQLRLASEKADIGWALQRLDGRTRLVLERHFGLDGEPEESLAQVSHCLGVSPERTRQIVEAGLAKLRPVLEAEAA